ncbi:MAG: CAP domain-containing protein [Nannocystaceae bacterium]
MAVYWVVAELCACSTATEGGGPGHADAASRRVGIELTPRTVRPDLPQATSYGGGVALDLSVGELGLRQRLEDLSSLKYDAGLSCLMRGLARYSPLRLNIPAGLVDALSSWCGVYDPPPRVELIEVRDDRYDCVAHDDGPCVDVVDTLVERATGSGTLPPGRRFGVGAARLENNVTRLLVGFAHVVVELETIDRRIDLSAVIQVKGRLLGGRETPHVEVVAPDGEWRRFGVVMGDDGSFSVALSCASGRGAYRVEVLAEGPHGPEVAALFPIFCGVSPPSEIEFETEHLDPSVSAVDVARLSLLYLNHARAARALPRLEWDDGAASVGSGHSGDMAHNGFVGHVSPTAGGVVDRFSAAKIRGLVIRENVARGYGPKGIHVGLMGSPGHRVNILAEDVTRVGIGVVFGEQETDQDDGSRPIFVTQVFYRPPDNRGPRDLARGLRRDVDKARAVHGERRLAWHSGLSKLAQSRVDARVRGGARDEEAHFSERVWALGFGEVTRHDVFAEDYGAMVALDVWLGIRAHKEVGAGIARVPAQGDTSAGFALCILVATRDTP